MGDCRNKPPYYNREIAERDFAPEPIRAQGELLLYRALNIGRAIAFVGSGLSAAYGRPTWRRLVEGAFDNFNEQYSDDKLSSEPVYSAIRKAAEEIASQAGVSDPDALPLKAHLVQTLLGKSERLRNPRNARRVLQEQIKNQVRDDDVVARNTWKPLIDAESAPKSVDGAPQGEPRDAPAFIRALDTRSFLRTLAKGIAPHIPDSLKGPLEVIVAQLEAGRAAPSARLSPEERLLIPLLDCLRRLYPKCCVPLAPSIEDDLPPDTRRPAELDPIRIILEQFKIRRFLTTNYDFELERALERIGFAEGELRPLASGNLRAVARDAGLAMTAARPRGDRARSFVLRQDTAADLVGFGVDASSFDYDVFHLHGRALPHEKEDLVITERDYQAIYMRDTPAAHVIDEALTVTMGGNPIIFFGMGMLEADILRPLRRFVTNFGVRANRSIIALMPAEEKQLRRTQTALQIYLRYGVHILFYGAEPREGDPARPGKSAPSAFGRIQPFKSAPWDPQVVAIEDPAPLYRSITRMASIAAALGDSGHTSGLKRWLGRDAATRAERIGEILDEISWKQGATALGNIQDLNPFRDLVAAMFSDNKLFANKSARLALQRFFWMLDNRIRTGALCAALNDIADARIKWWQRWRELGRFRQIARNTHEWRDSRWVLVEPTRRMLSDDGRSAFRCVRFSMPNEEEFVRDDAVRSVMTRIFDASVSPSGRRIFLVHGRAGAGRGTLYHALADEFGRDSRYRFAFLTNTTFSTEYNTIVDELSEFVDRHLRPTSSRQRVGKRPDLIATLSGLKERLGDQRGLFVLGGLELLFRRGEGTPKNFEMAHRLSGLLDPALEEAPLDVVLLCCTEEVETIFGKDAQAGEVQALYRFGAGTGGPESAVRFPATKIKMELPHGSEITKSINTELKATIRVKVDDILTGLTAAVKGEVASTRPHWIKGLAGRFERSIVTACAIETFRSSGGAEDIHSDSAAIAVTRFLVDLGDMQVRAAGRPAAEIALSATLRQYMALGPRGRWLRTPGDTKGHEDESKVDPHLCEEILKHLAIISTPVEPEVLLRCPEILRQLPNKTGAEDLQCALELLQQRKLVFRVASRPEISEPDGFGRFAVHQSLQKYFFRKVGSPHLEFGDSCLFTVTLFASQPVDLPAPNRSAYEFMRDLVRALSFYPETHDSTMEPSSPEWRHRISCLRAALGLIRSAFGLSVVSRFAEFGDAEYEADRPFGYMEEFRLLLRWLVYKAGVMSLEHRSDDERRSDPEIGRLEALYGDEITWLYNECGVASLAQGNLDDALALLHQARRCNRKIEEGDGPNALRIGLNIALAHIERGELRRASLGLRRLRDVAQDKEPLLAAIVLGYQGLVAHMRGRRELAARRYRTALHRLRRMPGEARSISIFSRHYGDMLRSQDLSRAKRLHRDALAEAENSGQHDQLYRCHIALAYDELEEASTVPGTIRNVLLRLDLVIHYADRMELHSLKSEALMARARAIAVQGETRGAGEAAVAALSLANLYGQHMRAIRALHIYGSIVAERPRYESQARLILQAARAKAEAVGYQSVIEMSERRLIELGITTPTALG